MAKKIAVYPGSFDPVTMGHIDLIYRAIEIFDEIIVAVAINSSKNTLFTIDERINLIKESVKEIEGVTVTGFDGLLVNHLKDLNVRSIIRGLRAISDFDYEFQIASMNRSLSPEVDTFFLMTSQKYFYLSSSVIKEVARFGGDITSMVPPVVKEALKNKFS
jgi:pantetheine-phosphate adenylyltransferase